MIARGGEARLVGLLVALGATLAAAVAEAEPTAAVRTPRVTLFAVTVDDPLAGRLAAELAALGLEVTREVISPTGAIEEQVRAAFSTGSRAAVVADGHRTEFWIAEEGSDRVALRQEMEIEGSPGLESVLSLRTVEFLRVGLGLATELETTPAGAPAIERAAPPRAPAPPRFSVDVASGVLAGSGRIGPLAMVAAGARARIFGPFGVEVDGYLPLGSDTVPASDGDVQTSLWMAGGGVLFAPHIAGPFSADVGAGLLAVVMRVVGYPTLGASGVTGVTDEGVGLAIYARAAARLRLAGPWSLRVDVTGGSTALRPPVIVEVTRWGRAFVAGLGGVDVVF